MKKPFKNPRIKDDSSQLFTLAYLYGLDCLIGKSFWIMEFLINKSSGENVYDNIRLVKIARAWSCSGKLGKSSCLAVEPTKATNKYYTDYLTIKANKRCGHHKMDYIFYKKKDALKWGT